MPKTAYSMSWVGRNAACLTVGLTHEFVLGHEIISASSFCHSCLTPFFTVLLPHLLRVVESKNSMDTNNLARCWAPTLCAMDVTDPTSSDGSFNLQLEMQKLQMFGTDLIEVMLEPSFIDQI